MAVLLVGGMLSLLTVHQEEFPNINTQMVSITVPYLGAAPEESELGVCLRIEEAIDGVEGIDKMRHRRRGRLQRAGRARPRGRRQRGAERDQEPRRRHQQLCPPRPRSPSSRRP
jgi:hypothetical protein